VQARLADELVDAERVVVGREPVLRHRRGLAAQRVPLLEPDRLAVELHDRLGHVMLVLTVEHLRAHVRVVVGDGRALPPLTDGRVAQPRGQSRHVVVGDRPEGQVTGDEVGLAQGFTPASSAISRHL
jgi:hypothetical protein